MADENGKYKTGDMYLASFLRASGLNVLDVTRDGRKAIFHFSGGESTKRIILEYYNEESMISALKFINAFHAMKNLIHEVKGPMSE